MVAPQWTYCPASFSQTLSSARITGTIGYAYSDTSRTATRRAFQFRGSNLPVAVTQLRPDYLLSDATIQLYDITMLETSAQDGTAAFDAGLTTHAGYAQLQAEIVSGMNVNVGVRYENGKQTVVPIDLLTPVLDDLRKFGRVNKPVRPWLGVYSTEVEDKVVIVGIAPKGPAARAELKTGDVVLAVKGERVSTLGEFYRRVWALGDAGVEVPLTLYREGLTFEVRVNSSDRAKFLKGPRLH